MARSVRTEPRSRRRPPGTLTSRQKEVLDLVADRYTNAQIAEKLGISLSAAKWHVSEIIATLGVDTREEAADAWRQHNGLSARLRRTAVSGLGFLSYRPFVIAGAATSVALLAAVAIFALTNNGNDPAPPSVGTTPTAEVSPTGTPVTPSPSADPLGNYTTYPLPSRDDLFVYTVATGQSAPGSRLFPERSVVVQDLSTGEIVSHFAYSGKDGDVERFPVGVAVAGRQIVVATESAVTRHELDGSKALTLFEPPEPQAVADIAVSGDGRNVAITSNCELACSAENGVTFFEVATGHQIAQVTQASPGFEDFDGDVWQISWKEDGSGVWVIGATYTDGGGGRAFVGINGEVEQYVADDWGFSTWSPSGRYLADGAGQVGCMRVGGRALRITDMDTGDVVANVTGEQGVYAVWEWAPDDSAVVYQFIAGEVDANCEWAGEPGQFRMYTLATGESEAVPDLSELHHHWYGDHFVEVVCDEPRPDSPVVSRYGYHAVCKEPLPGEMHGDVFVAGAKVATWPQLGDASVGLGIDPVAFLPR